MKQAATQSLCEVCRLRPAHLALCGLCGRAWDRVKNKDDGTLDAMLAWAARRAWRFALAQGKKARR
jgi:hypothetical protein